MVIPSTDKKLRNLFWRMARKENRNDSSQEDPQRMGQRYTALGL